MVPFLVTLTIKRTKRSNVSLKKKTMYYKTGSTADHKSHKYAILDWKLCWPGHWVACSWWLELFRAIRCLDHQIPTTALRTGRLVSSRPPVCPCDSPTCDSRTPDRRCRSLAWSVWDFYKYIIQRLLNQLSTSLNYTHYVRVRKKRPTDGCVRGTVVERRSWPANFPCPALDLQLMGDHLCG